MMDYKQIILNAVDERQGALDKEKISRAYDLAAESHEGQKRLSGEDYISHPVAVAQILLGMDCDTDTVISALLHDTLEDTSLSPAIIKKEFGEDVLLIVEGLSKLSKLNFTTKEEEQVENLRKMLLAMVKDIRVILIKLADRLHNMRTLSAKSEKRQREIAFETMQIYAPLADRLGVQRVKSELEDISISYLDPIAYHEIEKDISELKEKGESLLESIKENISSRMHDDMRDDKINFTIDYRVKQIYSIYNKMYTGNHTFDEIYDLYALRVIVDTIPECYYVLGIIHDMFQPLPGRFKDYISTPKPNLYQSLHTVVLSREGIPFEVQIRTWEMHRVAEFGIAAHWKYKGGITGASSIDSKLEWIRNILEDPGEKVDNEDLMQELKVNLFADQVFVFTPRGDVINLPVGSNPIDFAYNIHTAVGNRMIGAKVNGKIVELSYVLNNGDVCEVLTSKEEHGPSRDWINIVKSNSARTKIRQYLKRERRDENIIKGRSDLEREFRRNNMPLSGDIYNDLIAKAIDRYMVKDEDDLYATLGYGGLSVAKIMPKIREWFKAYNTPVKQIDNVDGQVPANRSSGGVIVEGIDNCLVKLAHCCNPLPGDDIVGFITRGNGVSVHKSDCPNIKSFMNDSTADKRVMKVSWDSCKSEVFASTLTLVCQNRIGFTADVATLLSNMHIMIHRMNARENKDGTGSLCITFDVKDTDHLSAIIASLNKIRGVIKIIRGEA